MKHLSKKNTVLMGLTLFSMFFGAGNLIFPPFLGNQAGTNLWVAMAGFLITAIGFPVLGVIAVAEAGGLESLAKRVHPIFASVFIFLIYVSIGPGLAIPRTASTSFEMAVLPFLPEKMSIDMVQLLYSIAFFAVAFWVALKPEKLSDRLGKITSPCLLTLIAVVFITTIFSGIHEYGQATSAYETGIFAKGFLDGYQTMDTIAALNFGFVIAIGIREKGISEEKQIVRETIKAGMIAGILLLIIYGILGHIGALASSTYQESTNGAQILTYVVKVLFGRFGVIIIGAIFFIACLNTCIGLLCCCSEYFTGICPKVPYAAWVAVFSVISILIANLGLDNILKFSVPVLNGIYPIAIVLIVLSFLHPIIKKYRFVYGVTIFMAGFTSILQVLESVHIQLPGIQGILCKLPFYEQQLLWIVPAIAGLVLGILLSVLIPERKNK